VRECSTKRTVTSEASTLNHNIGGTVAVSRAEVGFFLMEGGSERKNRFVATKIATCWPKSIYPQTCFTPCFRPRLSTARTKSAWYR
jgi:hypothetical protein